MAQAYNHVILPLANRRDPGDRRLGIRISRSGSGRKPGDVAPGDRGGHGVAILAEQGIRFTVLAPHQAWRVRAPGGQWKDLGGQWPDTTVAYTAMLPSGKSIVLFFYNGEVSRAVAFERLLSSGEQFARRLAAAFDPAKPGPQLVHIAADGETYSHHHRRERALATCLLALESGGAAHQLRGVFSSTRLSWRRRSRRKPPSCSHGVNRWWTPLRLQLRETPALEPGVATPLRDALDR